MIFEQITVDGLSHYSYIVGCNQTGEVAIVDPKRDLDDYLARAYENRWKIKYVLETHIHADYASGAKELAQTTGAELILSGYDEGEDYEVKFPHKEIYDWEEFNLGGIRIRALHTPGHTPEHLSFLVFDHARSTRQPVLMLSGDFVFAGSLGRPDLLGKKATAGLAKHLYKSVRKLLEFPGELEIYPAHGAGSLCGAGMGESPHTTLGMERISNPYLDPDLTEEGFVNKVTSSVPRFPEYYKKMKELNSEGPPALGGINFPPSLTVDEMEKARKKDGVFLDLRHPLAFGGGHIPGSINLGQGTMISNWAPWVVSYNKPLFLIAEYPGDIESAVRRLYQVGLDNIEGCFIEMEIWVHAGKTYDTITQVPAARVNEMLNQNDREFEILDVRRESEWEEGHIEGARYLYLGDLPAKAGALSSRKPLYVICGGGYRSSLATSILRNKGFQNIFNIYGGMTSWKAADLPVKTE